MVKTVTSSSKWYDLGLELLEQEHEEDLEIIKKNNPNDVSECCKQMFRLWLSKCGNPTWDQLMQALKEIELSNLATAIEGMLISVKDKVSAGIYVTIIQYKPC